MKVICISGRARHGKDTIAGFMCEELQRRGYSVLVAHYGDLVKYICSTFFGWNGVKDEKGRTILQRVGTDEIRRQEPDYWVGFIESVLRMFPNEWDYVLIPDCRFPNEIDYIRERGYDVTHVRVVRENFESPLTQEQQNHPSETALDNVIPDRFVLNNSTLEVLETMIHQYVDELVKE